MSDLLALAALCAVPTALVLLAAPFDWGLRKLTDPLRVGRREP